MLAKQMINGNLSALFVIVNISTIGIRDIIDNLFRNSR